VDQPIALITNVLHFAGPPAVQALRDAGFRIAAHDRAFASVEARNNFYPEDADVAALAAQDPEEIVSQAWALGNRLDVLVSNDAFRAIHGVVADASIDDLKETLDRLIVFPFALAKAAIPRLKRSGRPRVVMITSNRTRLPQPGGGIPDIARAGGNALARSLSIELAPYRIPVNAIAPNFLYSETYYPRARFIEDPKGREYVERTVPVARLGFPEEIGELVRYLATMQSEFLTGSIIDFSGGWPAGSPRPD
jgi:3-oxoacyl-[acyl-carrier protein] reductase